ncbi:MAG: hypothetical protein ACD_58C00331G0001 [uncultured bacterium]|nr:MAG: hypothetical protein ACD_58C00331G0001 [uncultured bacterium]
MIQDIIEYNIPAQKALEKAECALGMKINHIRKKTLVDGCLSDTISRGD